MFKYKTGDFTYLGNARAASVRSEDTNHHRRQRGQNDRPDDVHEVAQKVGTSASTVRHSKQFRPGVPLQHRDIIIIIIVIVIGTPDGR